MLQTGRWEHTAEEQWSCGGSWAVSSSFCLLYPGPPQGRRAGAAPPVESYSQATGAPHYNTGFNLSSSCCSVHQICTDLHYFNNFPGPRFPSPLPVVHRIQRAQQDFTCGLRVGQKRPVLGLYSSSTNTCLCMMWITQEIIGGAHAFLPYSCWIVPPLMPGTSSSSEESDEFSSASRKNTHQ